MLFVIRFVDKADTQNVRAQHFEAHLNWLEERKQSILVAGSLREQPGADPIGAWWVVEAESRSEVEELYRSDPFWTNGLRESVEILYWSKAFPDQQTVI